MTVSSSSRSRLLVLWLILVAFAAGCASESSSLPKLYPVPSVSLIDQTGVPVSLDSLHGKIAIYDFIFTRCAGTCPMMTKKMELLTKKLESESDLRFVSISVDPTWDTPDRLREYKARYSEDPRWSFLTGDRDEIVDLSFSGFKLAAGDTIDDGAEPLLHSSKFVLVDEAGFIRGYYDTFIEGDLETLEADARVLLEGL